MGGQNQDLSSCVGVNGSNDWKHIAATIDFGPAKMISLYVDGELQVNDATGTGDLTGVYPTNYARVSTETFWLGGLRRAGKTDIYIPFGGRLDDFRIVNAVLSPEYIKDYYNATSEAKRIKVGGALDMRSTNGWYAVDGNVTTGRMVTVVGGDYQDTVKHWISNDNGTNWVDVNAQLMGLYAPGASVWSGLAAYGATGSNVLCRVTSTNNLTDGIIYRWNSSWRP